MLDAEFYRDKIDRLTNARIVQGKDLDSGKPYPQKPKFNLCPELWFWAYEAGNLAYPEILTVSPTPFWSKGQATIDLRCQIDLASRILRELESESDE